MCFSTTVAIVDFFSCFSRFKFLFFSSSFQCFFGLAWFFFLFLFITISIFIFVFLSIWMLFGSCFFAVLMKRRSTLDYFENHSGH